ncbi:NYN domain-containing protein [Planctomycetes bacterium K23_9]|uniref:YacP-like NYN domain protein n=1 Tax=Stieleria marina TaxID=1930275 RepID=A0A517NP63_9BACT|nr:YacP-like NYN domain protein [Planctomycetes bacterium K23_9]
MSLLLLIDGYNVVSPVAPPSRNTDPNWLHRERMQLIDRLVQHLDANTRARTRVIFDAANPPRDRPSEYEIEGIQIRFAVDFPEADDLIEETIAAHHSPKQLGVVSSDHRVQAAAKRRGATCFDSEPWLDDLLDNRVRLAVKRPNGAGQWSADSEKPSIELSQDNVSDWMKEFGFDD